MINQQRVIWEEIKNDYHDCWRKVDRRNFVPREKLSNWHLNTPIKIGNEQTTSQPTLITQMIKILLTKYSEINGSARFNKKLRILDIGSGSGVVTALLACIIGNRIKENEVIGIEVFKALVMKSKNNINKIPIHIREKFSKVKIYKYDVYDLFNKPNTFGKFDLIYVGAEAKTVDDINKFKEGIPRLLNDGGIAVAPLNGEIQIGDKNSEWHSTNLRTRFVPLERKKRLKDKKTRKFAKQKGGINKTKSIKEQKRLIKDERKTRYSVDCKDLHPDKVCKEIAVTSRSAKIYRNHLFPDFRTMREIEEWAKDKCIIDVGSGINTSYNKSFISKLANKGVGIDLLGVDLKAPEAQKYFAERRNQQTKKLRFIKGDAEKLKLTDLKMNKKCKKNILLINNFLYLWIDDPMKLKKIFKNLFSWLKSGSEIRIFPVYFGRYDMYNKELKRYLEEKCYVNSYIPKYSFGNSYEWHGDMNKRVSLNENVKFEKKINRKLGAQTVVLTLK